MSGTLTFYKNKNDLTPAIFAYQSINNTIGLLTSYLDWVGETYNVVSEWGQSQIYFQPGQESFKNYVEGWLKFHIVNYIEIPLSNYKLIKTYLQTNPYPIYGCLIPFYKVTEINLNDDESRIKFLIEVLYEEKRISFSGIESTLLDNAIFQRCFALALQFYEKSLITNQHNYQESGCRKAQKLRYW